jgi:CO/xanthine dehydrogenase Mo-binding subunit
MLKSRFRIAGEVLVIATLAGSAAAQNPPAPINTVNELEAALLACWEPPPIEQSRPGMQITVLMSFKRNGELFGQPRITFQSRDASDVERASYQTAVAETLKRCASLPFTEAFGTALLASRSPCASSMTGSGPPTSARNPKFAHTVRQMRFNVPCGCHYASCEGIAVPSQRK